MKCAPLLLVQQEVRGDLLRVSLNTAPRHIPRHTAQMSRDGHPAAPTSPPCALPCAAPAGEAMRRSALRQHFVDAESETSAPLLLCEQPDVAAVLHRVGSSHLQACLLAFLPLLPTRCRACAWCHRHMWVAERAPSSTPLPPSHHTITLTTSSSSGGSGVTCLHPQTGTS